MIHFSNPRWCLELSKWLINVRYVIIGKNDSYLTPTEILTYSRASKSILQEGYRWEISFLAKNDCETLNNVSLLEL